jgi:hypothetical protein
MRVRYADTTPTPAHAVKAGDHVRERRSGEVRKVVTVVRTLTQRRFLLDDGSAFDAMFLDTVHVTQKPVTR